MAARLSGPLRRARSWLRRRDPELAAVNRAVRVTVAASVGFYICRYAVGDDVTAVYALFGAIALGALSTVSGAPAQRTRTYVAALAAGLVLATIGTLLAVSTWAAATGMLVVGFAVAYSGVAGPRASGVANGLQLFYVLPCFPPYAPDTLDERLVGLAVGVTLMAIADRVLLPAPAPPDFAVRIGATATAAARYARALQDALLGTTGDDPRLGELRDEAERAAEALRLSDVPVPQRPSGPGVRDRSMTVAAAAVRVIVGRLGRFADLQADAGRSRISSGATAELIGVVAGALEESGAALGPTHGPAPGYATLDTALTTYLALRRERVAEGVASPPRLLAALALTGVTESARTLVAVTRGVVGAPPPADTRPDLWFLHASPAELWWRRLGAHLTPRSVYLQNAVRLAAGLAVARVVAGVLDLSHGFWVLLATLSLMRTSAVASRSALVPAFAGTIAGAVVAAVVLTLVGYDTPVYAGVAPVIMLVAFAAGPLLGIAAGQAGFTLVVSVIFAQVTPATWQLAGVRLIDVVVGGLIGAVIGAAVWPRGGAGEIRRDAAATLHAGADEIVATSMFLTGPDGPPDTSAGLDRLAALFDHTYAQYRTEPVDPGPQPDWLTVLAVVHRIVGDARTLRARHPQGDRLPWPELAVHVRAAAGDVAEDYRAVARAVADGVPTPPGAAREERARLAAQTLSAQFATAPDEALRAFDAWAWMYGLVDDLGRVQRALAPLARDTTTAGEASRPDPA